MFEGRLKKNQHNICSQSAMLNYYDYYTVFSSTSLKNLNVVKNMLLTNWNPLNPTNTQTL